MQEWCQSKGFDLPVYTISEVSKKNGDPKRFSCDIFIKGLKESSAFGKSHKQAETNAARVLIEKFINDQIRTFNSSMPIHEEFHCLLNLRIHYN